MGELLQTESASWGLPTFSSSQFCRSGDCENLFVSEAKGFYMFLRFLALTNRQFLGVFISNCRFDFFNLDKEWNHLQPDLMQFVEGGALSCQWLQPNPEGGGSGWMAQLISSHTPKWHARNAGLKAQASYWIYACYFLRIFIPEMSSSLVKSHQNVLVVWRTRWLNDGVEDMVSADVSDQHPTS